MDSTSDSTTDSTLTLNSAKVLTDDKSSILLPLTLSIDFTDKGKGNGSEF